MELPLTHPEYYEEMGIKPPKGSNCSMVHPAQVRALWAESLSRHCDWFLELQR